MISRIFGLPVRAGSGAAMENCAATQAEIVIVIKMNAFFVIVIANLFDCT
jgi:hypothetical protein